MTFADEVREFPEHLRFVRWRILLTAERTELQELVVARKP